MAERYDFLLGRMIKEPTKKRKGKLPEAKVGEAVDAYLRAHGAYVRVIKSDGTKMPNGRWRTSNQGRGISDRLAWLPNGVMIAVELKAEGKKRTATPEQLDFLEALVNRGHRGCVADCVRDVELALVSSKEEMLARIAELRVKKESSLFVEPLF
jgi:hypothetical protein